ncbi:MAG: UDP-N-acetylmuramate dehydrogenase [Huintestinicola sp.]
MGEKLLSEKIGECSEIAAGFGCTVLRSEPMSRHTSFKIGGKCDCFIDINSAESLSELVKYMKRENVPYYVVGRGTNLLVSDNDIHKVILHIGREFSDISTGADGKLYCRSGAMLSAVCLAACEAGLTGMEFAYGIPGRIGGAVYMNAGAYGGEMKDIVLYADAMDEEGNIRRFKGSELDFGYRSSVFNRNNYIVTDVCIQLEKGDKNAINARMEELIRKRREKQPIEYPSAGSTFKRPEGAYAAALIEECGLKGYTVGGAKVSEKHSGFVINTGNATFNDVMAVMEHVRQTVKDKTGYTLEYEPEIID